MKALPVSVKAAALHITLSFIVISLVIGGLLFWFLPYPFIVIDDVGHVLKIVVGVDLTLGPLMTLILYKPGKKGLWFDMSAVVVLQFCALVYGAWAVYESRPAYLIFYGDSFYLANHQQIDQSTLSDKQLRVGAWDRPKIIAANISGTSQEKMQLALNGLEHGKPIQFDARYFSPLAQVSSEDFLQLALKNKNLPDIAKAYPTGYVFFHIISAQPHLIAVVELKTRRIIAIVTQNPHAH